MKLDNDQLKKLGIGGAVFAGLLYCYFAFLLWPLQGSEHNASNGIDSLGPQIDEAKQQIATTADLEKKAPAATAFLTGLKNSIPDGEPIAWLPPKITEFFKARGIDKTTTRMVSESDNVMPGFRKLTWSVDVPKIEFVPLSQAITALENQEPLINVLSITVDAIREDAQYQHAVLVITTLVKS